MSPSKAAGVATICALLLAAPVPVPAEGGELILVKTTEWAPAGRNELGIFAGVTTGGGDVGPSLGLSYEYRLNRRFGIGGLVELTGADFRDGVIAVPFTWRAREDLKILAAPGVAIDQDDGSDEVLLRVGGEYGFPMARGWEVRPALYFDLYGETVVVFGLSFALSF
jgi:hypothetical protein